jgi:O-methyltransferase involved in polyketide biosynthesis
VTPYLRVPAVRATLQIIAARSATGSRVAVTYGTPRASSLGPTFVRAALVGFRLVGEPIVGLVDSEAMHAELAGAGFRVVDDTAPVEWSARHGGPRRRVLVLDEHLVVAQRG